MKKLRFMSLILALFLLCMALSGCMGLVLDTKIEANGSGSATFAMGYTQAMIQHLAGSDEGSKIEAFKEESGLTQSFVHNGTTYYGQKETVTFSNVSEYNTATIAYNEMSVPSLSKRGDDFLLFFIVTPETRADLETSLSTEEFTEEEKALAEELMKNMAMVYTYTFASDVKQIAGPSEGVSISGATVSFDLTKLAQGITEPTCYQFATGDLSPVAFSDVPTSAWYYNAVTNLACGGLVGGVGDGAFNPDGTLTYAQFCQILARAKGLSVGEANGYWAGQAIASCIDAKYIKSQGDITAANYDVAIPREAAVAAMYLARPAYISEPVNEVTEHDIPDYDDISVEYQRNVLAAYRYGITTGADEYGTFLPKNNLKRSEICQLFYNIAWITE